MFLSEPETRESPIDMEKPSLGSVTLTRSTMTSNLRFTDESPPPFYFGPVLFHRMFFFLSSSFSSILFSVPYTPIVLRLLGPVPIIRI